MRPAVYPAWRTATSTGCGRRAGYWTTPTDGLGDCEDYALSKRKALGEAGLSRRALRLGVVRLVSGKAHAVLVVVTDRGDYVLDNRTDATPPWNETKLIWTLFQTAQDRWAALRNTGTRLLLAAR